MAKAKTQLEKKFQADLIKDIKAMFPGCFVLKNDSEYMQGIPDLTILYKDRWAVLENKRSRQSIVQPNQEYYVDQLDAMSFAAFIYPENREEVLRGLQRTLQASGNACIPQRK